MPDSGQSGVTGSPPETRRVRVSWAELGGALGDLGTFLPHVVAALTVVGMAPFGVLAGFGLFYIATGAFYGLPVAVQPMKAASAALLVGDFSPGSIAATGLAVGAVFLVLGASGLIRRLAAVIPAGVTAGLQLGLGLTLALLGLELIAQDWLMAAVTGGVLLAFMPLTRCPAALLALAAAVFTAWLRGDLPVLDWSPQFAWPALVLPTWSELRRGVELAALPQIPLTLTNAVIVTAALAQSTYDGRAHRVTTRNLALSTGAANLLLAPFGGYPMCHGAGGMAAHHRFGARTGGAPVLFGLLCLALAFLAGENAAAVLKAVPLPAVGCLLVFSGWELARRLLQARLDWSGLAVAAATAGVTVLANAAFGFLAGCTLAAAAWWQARGRPMPLSGGGGDRRRRDFR